MMYCKIYNYYYLLTFQSLFLIINDFIVCKKLYSKSNIIMIVPIKNNVLFILLNIINLCKINSLF